MTQSMYPLSLMDGPVDPMTYGPSMSIRCPCGFSVTGPDDKLCADVHGDHQCSMAPVRVPRMWHESLFSLTGALVVVVLGVVVGIMMGKF